MLITDIRGTVPELKQASSVRDKQAKDRNRAVQFLNKFQPYLIRLKPDFKYFFSSVYIHNHDPGVP